MNPADNPLDNLSRSLTGELNQQTADQRRAAIGECEALLASVPAATELAVSRRVRGFLLLSLAFLLSLGTWCLSDPEVWWCGVLLILMALASARSLWLQRKAGTQAVLRLTHDGLWFACLNAELAMAELVQARVKEGRQVQVILTLKEGARLPGTCNTLGPWLPKAKVVRSLAPEVTLSVFGLEHQGKALTVEQIMGLLLDYGAAAQAKAQLKVLRGAAQV